MRLTDNEFHTKENKERACYIQEPRLQAIYDKLFDLEDIEEELGIDLITLFKALENRFYVSNDKYNTDKCFGALSYGFDNKKWSILGFAYGYEAEEWLNLEDYGKTWALTKEELL